LSSIGHVRRKITYIVGIVISAFLYYHKCLQDVTVGWWVQGLYNYTVLAFDIWHPNFTFAIGENLSIHSDNFRPEV
jgi:hypothetical protein